MPKSEQKRSDKDTEEQTTSQGTQKQVLTRIKHEDESVMSASCQNGSTTTPHEKSTGLTAHETPHKEMCSSQRTVISKPVNIKTEKDDNSQSCVSNREHLSSQNATVIAVSTNCSDLSSNTATHSVATGASDTRVKVSGHYRVTSGANLSGRSRVIQQPPAKHCSTCNIDFNSLSNFIAHKKYYCSARQQAKS